MVWGRMPSIGRALSPSSVSETPALSLGAGVSPQRTGLVEDVQKSTDVKRLNSLLRVFLKKFRFVACPRMYLGHPIVLRQAQELAF